MFRRFREAIEADGLAPSSLRQFDTWVMRFFESIGAKKFSDITIAKAEAHKARRRAAGRAGTTINAEIYTVKRFLNWAVDHDEIGLNPLVKLKKVKEEPVHERRALEIDEIHRLLDASPEWYRPIWTLFICTGMRRSELVYLRWRDVNLARGIIRLEARRTKTRKERLVFFGPRIEKMMRGLGQGKPESLVFMTKRGTPRKNNLLRALRHCVTAAKVNPTGVDIHALRATFATLVMETGADLKTAQTLIGHGSASGILLLDRYAKPRLVRLREYAAGVEALVMRPPRSRQYDSEGQDGRCCGSSPG